MARTILKWGGLTVAGLVGLLLVVVAVAAATDRPSVEPVVIERDAPAVAAFLDAEHAWLSHHGLEHTEHVVEVAALDVRVRVLEVGDGPPVLLLPGGAGDAGYFVPLIAELDGYRLLLVNLPGGGASDGLDLRAVDDRGVARDTLDAVADHFALDAAPIIGNSRGGAWAWWYALDRPDRVPASVQLGVPAYLEGATVPSMLGVLGVPGVNRILVSAPMLPATPAEAADSLRVAFGHPPATVDGLGPGQDYMYAAARLPTYALSWRSGNQAAVRLGGLGGWRSAVAIGVDDLAGLDHPTLLVWPSDDPFGDPDVGREIAGHVPDVTFEIAGVGHLPWLDDPVTVAELITGFLEAETSHGTP